MNYNYELTFITWSYYQIKEKIKVCTPFEASRAT